MTLHLHHRVPDDTCEHGLPHIACGRCIDPHIRVIAVALPMLDDLRDTLCRAGWRPEANIASGLLELLAESVQSNSPPGSEEFAAAEAVLAEGE